MALVWYYHRYEHDTPGIDYLEQNRVKCTCKVGRSSVEGNSKAAPLYRHPKTKESFVAL